MKFQGSDVRTSVQAGDVIIFNKHDRTVKVERPQGHHVEQLKTEGDSESIYVHIAEPNWFITILCTLTGLQSVELEETNVEVKWHLQEGPSLVAEVKEEQKDQLITQERKLIIEAMTLHKGKRRDVAASLGISERTLYRKLKDYDIAEV